jgi:peptide deformylase
MLKKIVQKDARVLRQLTKEVPTRKITSPEIKKIIKEMSAALKSQSDGVALAAPQIGYPLKIFVVSGRIFHPDFARGETITIPDNEIPEDLVFINPVISKLSREKSWVWEGCLSTRWLYGKALRSQKATITAYDPKGKKIIRGASGLLAQIFQHETEHLKGVLFIDHAKEIREELPK